MKVYETDYGRLDRAKTQKIYLISQNITNTSAKFRVMGTTQNIYDVELTSEYPTCSCPDHMTRRKRCKHILFMLVKILNITDYLKEKYTITEIYEHIQKYQDNLKKYSIIVNEHNKIDVGEKCIDDNCCICLDLLQNGDPYVHCTQSCGRCIHTDCYNIVVKATNKCPYCSQKFVV